MKPKSFVLLLLAVMTVLFAGWIFYADIEDYLFSPPVTGIPASAVPKEPEAERLPMPPRHPVAPPNPVPVVPASQPTLLPFPAALEQADSYLNEHLARLLGDRDLLRLVNLNYFIQKLVLSIDHLPEKTLPRLHLPLIPPEPGFATRGSGEQRLIAKGNAVRYLPYVKLVEAIPDEQLLQLYRGLYPLFQQAYREIAADPHGHFNDRLIQVLDDLLQTPEPTGPIAVVRHVSRFRYADESLEARSAGQKILLRMGLENTRRVKEKLQRLRLGLARKDW